MPRITLSKAARERRKGRSGKKKLSNGISRRRNGRFRAEEAGRSTPGQRVVLAEPGSPIELNRALIDIRQAHKMSAPEREEILARKAAAAWRKKRKLHQNQVPSKDTARRIKEVQKRYGRRGTR